MRRVLGYGLALIVVAFLLLCIAVNLYGSQDQAASADIIVTLGARVLPDGSPSADLASRVAQGAALFQSGYAPYVVCAGGFEGDKSSAAAVSRNLAIELGVPAEKIFLAENSMSTQEDALQVAHVMSEHGWQSAIVVSHPLHLLRAKILFAKEGIDVVTSPTPGELSEMSLETRVYYTMREALGVVVALLPKAWGEIGHAYLDGNVQTE
jgi:uncharacterized SAM-binding protein YcdF (DUF218 family)